MPRQIGIIKLEGTLGDVSFIKTKDGYLVRNKTGVKKGRIANDPAYARTRENNEEFGRAGKGGKLIRSAFSGMLKGIGGRDMMNNLLKAMFRVIHADLTSVRGKRNVVDGEAELLKGFEFNNAGLLNTSLLAPYTSAINRATGELKIDLAAFVPMDDIKAPATATHFQVVSCGAGIDFSNEVYEVVEKETPVLPINGTPTAAISLVHNLPAASTRPLFLVLGLRFYQMVNGATYALKSGAFNSLAIVNVSGI